MEEEIQEEQNVNCCVKKKAKYNVKRDEKSKIKIRVKTEMINQFKKHCCSFTFFQN